MMPRRPPIAPCRKRGYSHENSTYSQKRCKLVKMLANQLRRNWRPASDSGARALCFERRTKIVVTNPQTKQNQLGMQWICNGYDPGIRVIPPKTHSGNNEQMAGHC